MHTLILSHAPCDGLNERETTTTNKTVRHHQMTLRYDIGITSLKYSLRLHVSVSFDVIACSLDNCVWSTVTVFQTLPQVVREYPRASLRAHIRPHTRAISYAPLTRPLLPLSTSYTPTTHSHTFVRAHPHTRQYPLLILLPFDQTLGCPRQTHSLIANETITLYFKCV